MKYLRQSTVATVPVGPFLDKADGFTAKAALTDQSANGRLIKNGTGGTVTVSSWTHDANGEYLVGLSTSHTDTIGRLRLKFTDAVTYLPVWEDFTVLDEAVYDVVFGTVAPATHTAAAVAALVAAGGVASVAGAVGSVAGNVGGNVAGSVASVATGGITAATFANDALSAAAVSAAAVTKIQLGLATSTEVTAIQNNTRVVRVVPDVIERPDSGSIVYRVELLLYDEVGNMEAPDAAPTIDLVNQAGADRTARLDSTTMTSVSTGRYRSTYTASVSDALEQLVWTFSVVEGGSTRLYGNTTLVVDTTAVDFTATDRSTLAAILAVSGAVGDAVIAVPTGVWAAATRTLTAGTNIVLTKGTGVTGFNDLNTAGVAAAVWDAATASYGGAGSYGLLMETNLNAPVSGRSGHSAADVWAVATRVLTAGTNIVLAKGTGITGLNDLSAPEVNAEADAALADVGLTTTVTGRIDAGLISRTLPTASYATATNQTTILARLGAFTGTGLNTVLGFFRALLRKDAALTPSDVGGSFDNTENSTEAIRDRGDAAWMTGGGGGGGGDATAANQDTIIDHLTDIKGSGWAAGDNLHGVKSDTAAILEDTGTTGVVVIGGITLPSGTVASGVSTTVFTSTDITPAAPSGGFNGQTVFFRSGALAGERRTITTHTKSGATHTFTLAAGDALTAAPAAGVSFTIA